MRDGGIGRVRAYLFRDDLFASTGRGVDVPQHHLLVSIRCEAIDTYRLSRQSFSPPHLPLLSRIKAHARASHGQDKSPLQFYRFVIRGGEHQIGRTVLLLR